MVVYSLSNNEASYSAKMYRVGASHMLGFECRRKASKIDPRIARIYQNAVQGKAHKDMTPPHLDCPGDYAACGNRRGFLTECRCAPLDRMKYPQLRYALEERVIERIIAILKEQPKGKRRINLAFFASNQLFGEITLLFRLFARLRSEGISCEINLGLIDTCYASALGQTSAEGALQSQKALRQFTEEICKTLPKGVKVSGQVFAGDKAYVDAATAHPKLKHDLLVGADIENLNPEMAQVNNTCSKRPSEKPLVLIKKEVISGSINPEICTIELDGSLSACTNPSSTQIAQKRSMTNGEITACAVSGLLLAGLLGGGIYSLVAASRRSNIGRAPQRV